MESVSKAAPVSRKAFWLGWIIGVVPALMLIASATAKFIQPTGIEESLEPLGWRADQLYLLGTLEIVVVVLYLIPRTAVLGAILVTGYMGGAIATHVRIGDYFILPHIIIGVLIWLGVWLRDPRLRALIPLRS